MVTYYSDTGNIIDRSNEMMGIRPKPKIEINPRELFKPELIYINVVQTDNSKISMDHYTKYLQKPKQ